jgi:hypothetical protein
MDPAESSRSLRREDKALSPLAQRLVGALRHLSDDHDELTMVVKGFERYMRKNPLSDEDILGGLTSVRDHINIVIGDNAVSA